VPFQARLAISGREIRHRSPVRISILLGGQPAGMGDHRTEVLTAETRTDVFASSRGAVAEPGQVSCAIPDEHPPESDQGQSADDKNNSLAAIAEEPGPLETGQ